MQTQTTTQTQTQTTTGNDDDFDGAILNEKYHLGRRATQTTTTQQQQPNDDDNTNNTNTNNHARAAIPTPVPRASKAIAIKPPKMTKKNDCNDDVVSEETTKTGAKSERADPPPALTIGSVFQKSSNDVKAFGGSAPNAAKTVSDALKTVSDALKTTESGGMRSRATAADKDGDDGSGSGKKIANKTSGVKVFAPQESPSPMKQQQSKKKERE